MIGVLERLEELARRRNKTGEWARLTPWELIALLRVVRAAKKVAKYEQTYQAHKDDSDEEHPICSICESWLNRCEELDAALSALQEEKP